MTLYTVRSVANRVQEVADARRCPVCPAPQVPYVEFPIPTSYDIGAFMGDLKRALAYNRKLKVSLWKLRSRYRIRVEEK